MQLAKEMLESQHSIEAMMTKYRLHAEQLEIKNAELLHQIQERKTSVFIFMKISSFFCLFTVEFVFYKKKFNKYFCYFFFPY